MVLRVDMGHGGVGLVELGHGVAEWVMMNYGGTGGGAHFTGGSKH